MTTTTSASSPTASRTLPGLQRAGGIASLVKAATYLVGFGVLGAYLAPAGFLEAQGDPARSLAFLLDHQTALYTWYLVLYVIGGAALVSLVIGVHDRLRRAAHGLSQTAAAVGLLWAGLLLASGLIALVGQRAVIELAAADPVPAVSTWASVSVVQDALGGGIEVVGAAWVLLVSIAGSRSGALSRSLGALGIAVGVAGAWTLVPQVADHAHVVFGLGFIAWFVWAGISLLHGHRHAD
jgi:hypothetical protein